ncbi:glycosyltransferase family 2 protein [soil metagenome]
MKVSVVTTMYHSRSYLVEFYDRAVSALKQLNLAYEFIFVNDGSPDDSMEVILELQKRDKNVVLIELSRNFGHHKAIMSGLRETTGDLVYLIDCDLEEEPELLIPFYSRMNEKDADVVYGVQEQRKGKLRERFFGMVFYKIFNHFAEQPIPANIIMARLMRRTYVNELLRFDEKEFFLGATFASLGFRQEALTVKKINKGSSTYNFRKRVALMVNAITSTSNKPLVYVFYFGAFISFISFSFIVAMLIRHFFFSRLLTGWPSLILSIWFLSGLIILCIGVVGIYLSKIYSETKQRPTVTIRKKYVVE